MLALALVSLAGPGSGMAQAQSSGLLAECGRLAGQPGEPRLSAPGVAKLDDIRSIPAVVTCRTARDADRNSVLAIFRSARAHLAPGAAQDIGSAVFMLRECGGGFSKAPDGTFGGVDAPTADWYAKSCQALLDPVALRESAGKGDLTAQLILAEAENDERWLSALADLKHPYAFYLQGRQAQKRRDFEGAETLFDRSARAGLAAGQFALAELYRDIGRFSDKRHLVEPFFAMAAANGSMGARYAIQRIARARSSPPSQPAAATTGRDYIAYLFALGLLAAAAVDLSGHGPTTSPDLSSGSNAPLMCPYGEIDVGGHCFPFDAFDD